MPEVGTAHRAVALLTESGHATAVPGRGTRICAGAGRWGISDPFSSRGQRAREPDNGRAAHGPALYGLTSSGGLGWHLWAALYVPVAGHGNGSGVIPPLAGDRLSSTELSQPFALDPARAYMRKQATGRGRRVGEADSGLTPSDTGHGLAMARGGWCQVVSLRPDDATLLLTARNLCAKDLL